MADNPQQKSYRAPAVQKAFNLLEIISRSPVELSLSELARLGNISKSSAHGLTQTMLEMGILVQVPGSQTFNLGPAIFELAFSNWNVFKLRELAEPYLCALRDQTGETVFLGFQAASRVVIIAAAESTNTLKIASPTGTSLPLLAGALGKALLAVAGEEQARKVLGKHRLRQFTPRSIVDPEAYLEEIKKVRQAGYALDDEEYLRGIRAVAVALGNRHGLPLLFWLVGFSSSLTDERLAAVAQSATAIAAKLRLLLDGPGGKSGAAGKT